MKKINSVISKIALCGIIIAIIGIVILVQLVIGVKHREAERSYDSSAGSLISSEISERKLCEVVRIKDGDTYVLKIGDEDVTVRLIGVDTPESVAPETYEKSNTSEGAKVSEIVKEKIKPGDKLYLEYDISQTDKYGRTLAYLYFENGVMVQEWLLENGYAQTMTIQPNSKYAERFANIQHNAAENKVGLWGGAFESES